MRCIRKESEAFTPYIDFMLTNGVIAYMALVLDTFNNEHVAKKLKEYLGSASTVGDRFLSKITQAQKDKIYENIDQRERSSRIFRMYQYARRQSNEPPRTTEERSLVLAFQLQMKKTGTFLEDWRDKSPRMNPHKYFFYSLYFWGKFEFLDHFRWIIIGHNNFYDSYTYNSRSLITLDLRRFAQDARGQKLLLRSMTEYLVATCQWSILKKEILNSEAYKAILVEAYKEEPFGLDIIEKNRSDDMILAWMKLFDVTPQQEYLSSEYGRSMIWLHVACDLCKANLIKEWRKSNYTLDFTNQDREGMTPIGRAVSRSKILLHSEEMYDLIYDTLHMHSKDSTIDKYLNKQDRYGKTLLMLAAENPDAVAIFIRLMQAGAITTLTDKQGNTFLHRISWEAIQALKKNKEAFYIKRFYQQDLPKLINHRNDTYGETPLLSIITEKNAHRFKDKSPEKDGLLCSINWMLDVGANGTAVSENGDNMLHKLANEGYQLYQLLIKHKVLLKVINRPNCKGESYIPIMIKKMRENQAYAENKRKTIESVQNIAGCKSIVSTCLARKEVNQLSFPSKELKQAFLNALRLDQVLLHALVIPIMWNFVFLFCLACLGKKVIPHIGASLHALKKIDHSTIIT